MILIIIKNDIESIHTIIIMYRLFRESVYIFSSYKADILVLLYVTNPLYPFLLKQCSCGRGKIINVNKLVTLINRWF